MGARSSRALPTKGPLGYSRVRVANDSQSPATRAPFARAAGGALGDRELTEGPGSTDCRQNVLPDARAPSSRSPGSTTFARGHRARPAGEGLSRPQRPSPRAGVRSTRRPWTDPGAPPEPAQPGREGGCVSTEPPSAAVLRWWSMATRPPRPRSAKAERLLCGHYAAVGSSGRFALDSAIAALRKAAARDPRPRRWPSDSPPGGRHSLGS